MNAILTSDADLLSYNINNGRTVFTFGSDSDGASIATSHLWYRQRVDIDKLKHCYNLLKQNAGVFSNMRGNFAPILVGRMALADNPKELLDNVLQTEPCLRKEFGSLTQYLHIVALYLACDPNFSADSCKRLITDSHAIYKRISRNHKILTSSNDILYCMALAKHGISPDMAADLSERSYTELKHSINEDAALRISEALILFDGSPERKCEQVITLIKDLKFSTNWHSNETCLIALSALYGVTADQVCECSDYLKKLKGFGLLGNPTSRRIMFAAALNLIDRINEEPDSDKRDLFEAIIQTTLFTAREDADSTIACNPALM